MPGGRDGAADRPRASSPGSRSIAATPARSRCSVAGQAAAGATPAATACRPPTTGPSYDVAHLRRQSRQPSLLARRSDHEGQLQPAADRVAAEDRLPGPASRHALFGHAAAGRPRALHDRRHAARGDRAQRRHRRDALDAHRGRRPRAARTRIRNGAGRGLAYWASADGADRRIIYVTPGYRLLALDAKTGVPIPAFGRNGAVDLKLEDDQDVDLDTGELGLNATPLVVGDVIVVGAAHRPGAAPRTMKNAKGYVRGYDVRTGQAALDLPHDSAGRASSATTRGWRVRPNTTATPARGRR